MYVLVFLAIKTAPAAQTVIILKKDENDGVVFTFYSAEEIL